MFEHVRPTLLIPIGILIILLIGCNHDPGFYMERGNQLYDRGDFPAAVIEYRNALQKDGSLGKAYYRIALCEIARKRVQEAYAALLNATRLDPTIVDARIKLAEMSLALYVNATTTRQGLADRVTNLANGLLQVDPTSIDGVTLKGRLAMLDQRYGQAIDFFEKAVASHPTNDRAELWLAQALLQAGQGDECEKHALRLIERSPSFGPTYDLLVRYYQKQEDSPKAEAILRRRIRSGSC